MMIVNFTLISFKQKINKNEYTLAVVEWYNKNYNFQKSLLEEIT